MKPHEEANKLLAIETGQDSHSQRARWTFNIEKEPLIHGVSELVMLGSDDLRKASPLFEHDHPGCYEFVLIERGKARWELDSFIYETHAGDLFHTRPGEKHRGGFNVIEPCKFWWLIVKAPLIQDWLSLPLEEIRQLDQAMLQLQRVKNIGLTPVETFKKLKTALMSDSPLKSTIVRSAILELIIAFIQPSGGTSAIAADLLSQYSKLIDKMTKEPEWRPAVDELAAFAGVSVSHFYRTFQDYTGEPPITFVERLRIRSACRQLKESQDKITDISYRLGYQSSQHFATVFKRFMGVTPSEWRCT
ncbi:AraC-like DNA-binding protein/quercetin dioxygenase-like cupin family protein [Paenibacillus endophyticus]|uniref:AraC-like DNA-binding protein/quercetin dioxygenase-like cupin family protein n=1 Tax=Paenibacillus endophyticus TaxID=1294268 RepID=A0A7W5CBM3_9BACL|nr:helix-turn-helix domain-containing protein [Paenibacillus endophyticus]MBB3154727.1 AraC-like DNA-binding protein/quercetin dioxygenase-like cupin family protein [Paenibacillus endophyticus]